MRLTKSIALLGGISFGLFTAACSRTSSTDTAANPTANPTTPTYADRPATPSSMDKDFASKAAQGGLAEVEMGKLARRLGATQQVRDFGDKLVSDHTALNNQLKDIAARENLSLPADVSSSQRSTIDKLAKLSGLRFDSEFKKVAVDDHKDDIKEFQKEADSGTDLALKDFASSAGPKLQDHLSSAEAISH